MKMRLSYELFLPIRYVERMANMDGLSWQEITKENFKNFLHLLRKIFSHNDVLLCLDVSYNIASHATTVNPLDSQLC